jgi:hypothetical protein
LFIVFLHRFEIDLMDGPTSAQLHREVNLFIEEDGEYEKVLDGGVMVARIRAAGSPA